jgi:pimeloyl-ACP methyl ester carboxylesterase
MMLPALRPAASRRDLLLAGAASLLSLSSLRAFAAAGDEAVEPFSFHASDAALDDLKQRLARTRWPATGTVAGWQQGVPLATMQDVVGTWGGSYDWRRCEADFDRWPQFKTNIDGLGIHFQHIKSRHQGALPIILTHGWPSTFLLFRDVIGNLTDPTAYGGEASDAFDVVIPSLPGFAFSDKPTEPGWNSERIARAWGVLMQRLGYRRYVAQGGDWGAFVTTAMAQQRAPGLAAIHLNFAQTIPNKIPAKLLPDQKRAVEALTTFQEKGGGYFKMQSTRPQTVGYALADSPVGEAAWIYDIFDSGTGQTGRPEDFLSREHMLDEITMFWLTDSAASSARLYYEQNLLRGQRNNPGKVELPVAVSVFPHDLPPARSWALQVYPKLFYWHELDRGGHFASLEVPELFTEELRRSFRRFRGA